MSGTATLPLNLDLELTIAKKGAVFSAANKTKIQAAKKALKEFSSAMEGIFADLGIEDDSESAADVGGDSRALQTAGAVPGTPKVEDAIPLNLKILPLDKLVYAVSEAVSRLSRGSMMQDIPYDQCCQVAAIYPDAVIIREGLSHWRASYTVEECKVELAPRNEWEMVEIDWKPASTEPMEMKSAPVFSTVKMVSAGRLGHYALLWGDTTKRDLYREFFTPQTQELDIIFKAIGKLPALYHHGFDHQVKTAVVGVVDTMTPNDIGLWVETQLNMADEYAQAIAGLAEAGKLGTSTGTLPGSRKVAPSGAIERWAIAEVSFTPTPAEPRMRLELPVTVLKAAYHELGLEFPEQESADTGAAEARRQELELEREALALLQLAA
jgi:hypothetical protein